MHALYPDNRQLSDLKKSRSWRCVTPRTSFILRPNIFVGTWFQTCEAIFRCIIPVVFYAIRKGLKVKVKWSRYSPGMAKRVGRGIALLFHDRGTRRGWVVSSRARPHFTPGKDTVPILQEAGWAPGPVWTGGKSRLHRDSIQDRPARSQKLESTDDI